MRAVRTGLRPLRRRRARGLAPPLPLLCSCPRRQLTPFHWSLAELQTCGQPREPVRWCRAGVGLDACRAGTHAKGLSFRHAFRSSASRLLATPPDMLRDPGVQQAGWQEVIGGQAARELGQRAVRGSCVKCQERRWLFERLNAAGSPGRLALCTADSSANSPNFLAGALHRPGVWIGNGAASGFCAGWRQARVWQPACWGGQEPRPLRRLCV